MMTNYALRGTQCPPAFCAWSQRRVAAWLFSLGLLLVISLPARAQSYLTEVGSPTFTTAVPVRNGFVNVANGNLHLTIPLTTLPGRGKLTYSAGIAYDSRIWQAENNVWEPNNIGVTWDGWRLVTSGPGTPGDSEFSFYCLDHLGDVIGERDKFYNYTWTAPDGTTRVFPITLWQYSGSGSGCTGTSNGNGSSYANDSSGYYMTVVSYGVSEVLAPDGTQVYPQYKDTNGNYYSEDKNFNVIDTLGRTPVTVTSDYNGHSNETLYAVLNSQGTTSPYVVTTESIPVHTAFGKSGVTEYSGNITVIQSIQLPDGTSYQFSYDQGSASGHYGELTGITLPTGGTISYTYTNFGGVNQWVSSYSEGSNTWNYSFTTTSSCPAGYTGGNIVTLKKPSGDKAVYTFCLSNGAWQSQVQYESSSGTVYRTVADSWTNQNQTNYQRIVETVTDQVPSGSLARARQWTYGSFDMPNVTEVQEWKYYSGSRPTNPDRQTVITYNTNSNYVNANIINLPTEITVENGSGGTVSDTKISYDGSALTSQTGVVNHDDTNYGTGNTVRGNPTTIQRLVSGSTYLTTSTMAYDMTGQMLSTTDSKNNTTSLSYSDNFYNDAIPPTSYSPSTKTNAYLTQATLPIIGAGSFGYYWGSGQLTYSKDQNGQSTYHHYIDDFDRPTETLPPIGWNLTTYASTETQIDSYLGITDTTPSASCSSCRHDQAVLDSLGRPTDGYLVSDPDGETTVATSYDSNDRVSQSDYPYRGTVNAYDQYTYDPVDRVTTVTHADSTSASIAYGASVSGTGVNTSQLCSSSTYGYGYPTLATDEAGKMREIWTDGFGRTIEVDEPNSSGSLTENTCYSYDLNNNLTQVVSATSQTRSYSYDDLSRVLSVSVPETNVGGTQYSTTYAYLSSGSACSGDPTAVCSRTDPRGITSTYTYDALNRLTKITYSDSTPTVTYCYDGSNSTCISGGYSSTNGEGRRTAMSDGSGSTGWSYDADGRIVTEKRTIGTVTKTISYSYNEDGSIASISYPGGRVITYATGDAERALSAVDSSNNINYALMASYSAAGAVSGVIYGRVSGGFNGTTEARQYNNRLEITSITASSSNGNAMNLSPCYTAFTLSSSSCSGTATGNNGSVTGIVNGVDSNTTLGFSYDTLNRILSALTKSSSGNDCWGQGFGPDVVANLTSISVSQCTAGSLSATTDGYNHLSNTGYSYDHAGDMTSDGSYTYTYDAEQRITSAHGWSYAYDGNGLRVEKTNSKLYWRSLTGDVLEETGPSGILYDDYIYFAGRKIASISNDGVVNFYYADTLGTIHTITNGTGTACYDATFTPYGQEMLNPNISQTCSSNYKFTGYEYDSETGLYYAQARYYNPRLGRFMSADPLAGDVGDPQSLNRYAYVANNPENLIDPQGLTLTDIGGGCMIYSQSWGVGQVDANGKPIGDSSSGVDSTILCGFGSEGDMMTGVALQYPDEEAFNQAMLANAEKALSLLNLKQQKQAQRQQRFNQCVAQAAQAENHALKNSIAETASGGLAFLVAIGTGFVVADAGVAEFSEGAFGKISGIKTVARGSFLGSGFGMFTGYAYFKGIADTTNALNTYDQAVATCQAQTGYPNVP